MSEMDRITNKLGTYLTKELGFKKVGERYVKVLKEEKDFFVSPTVVMNVVEGRAYGGDTDYIYSLVEENYIVKIEESFTEHISPTAVEATWLDSDEDGCYGIDIISEWIWDNIEVSCNHAKVDKFVNSIKKAATAA